MASRNVLFYGTPYKLLCCFVVVALIVVTYRITFFLNDVHKMTDTTSVYTSPVACVRCISNLNSVMNALVVNLLSCIYFEWNVNDSVNIDENSCNILNYKPDDVICQVLISVSSFIHTRVK